MSTNSVSNFANLKIENQNHPGKKHNTHYGAEVSAGGDSVPGTSDAFVLAGKTGGACPRSLGKDWPTSPKRSSLALQIPPAFRRHSLQRCAF
mmetsp:Transcript_9286/g.12984  ORF Transcript_9286/g.12984 Transcript_9286/m.12984 type:complete len:92 (+) Transcript_9286:117-392(+)